MQAVKGPAHRHPGEGQGRVCVLRMHLRGPLLAPCSSLGLSVGTVVLANGWCMGLSMAESWLVQVVLSWCCSQIRV